jgi:hypothetical protein
MTMLASQPAMPPTMIAIIQPITLSCCLAALARCVFGKPKA